MQLVQENIKQLRTGCLSEILYVKKGELQFVLKAVESTAVKQVGHLLNEWSVLSRIQHPNIVNVINCLKKVTIPGKEGIYFILAQEFAKQGNLSQLVRKKLSVMSFANRRYFFWELAQSIDYLHSNNVVHRDLKLDNVLVFQNQQGLSLKLADFGFAKKLTENDQMIGSYKGTKRGFMAPEIHECKDNPSKTYDGKAADIFALGVILFALVFGRLPFQFAIPQDRNYKLLMGDDSSQFWATLNPIIVKLQETEGAMISEFKNLFQGLVKYNPKQRLKIGEVLQYEWLLGQKERMSV